MQPLRVKKTFCARTLQFIFFSRFKFGLYVYSLSWLPPLWIVYVRVRHEPQGGRRWQNAHQHGIAAV